MASTTTNPFTTLTDLTTMNPAPQKEYNIDRSTPFTGDWTKIENFVQECNVYLNINDTIYDTDAVKIAFVLSFIIAGEAQKWKEEFICSITSNSRMTFPTFSIFMMKLQDAFKADRLSHAKAGFTTTRKLTSGGDDHQFQTTCGRC